MDAVIGMLGNDVFAGVVRLDIHAEQGNETFPGDAGCDFLAGGGHNDLILGGAGDDTMDGGAGADLFIFNDLVNGKSDRFLN